MLLKEFREQFLELLLTFLWRQWSILGVLGESASEEDWIIDPEALLIFSLEIARYEPRLFDEILSWLWANAHLLDPSRIKKILLERESEDVARVVGSSLSHVAEFDLSRKLRGIIKFSREKFMINLKEKKNEPLFKLKSGSFHPLVEENKCAPRFMEFGLNRPHILKLRKGKDVPVDARTNIRFLLRYFFGVGARSESVLYLLTHESGRPSEMANATGYFWLTIRDALDDLKNSNLILTRQFGKRIEYRASHKKWWEFISSSNVNEKKPKWINWCSVFSALSILWSTIDEISQKDVSEYMKSSRLQDSLEIIFREFSIAGIDIEYPPSAALPREIHQEAALNFLKKVLGANNG